MSQTLSATFRLKVLSHEDARHWPSRPQSMRSAADFLEAVRSVELDGRK